MAYAVGSFAKSLCIVIVALSISRRDGLRSLVHLLHVACRLLAGHQPCHFDFSSQSSNGEGVFTHSFTTNVTSGLEQHPTSLKKIRTERCGMEGRLDEVESTTPEWQAKKLHLQLKAVV